MFNRVVSIDHGLLNVGLVGKGRQNYVSSRNFTLLERFLQFLHFMRISLLILKRILLALWIRWIYRSTDLLKRRLFVPSCFVVFVKDFLYSFEALFLPSKNSFPYLIFWFNCSTFVLFSILLLLPQNFHVLISLQLWIAVNQVVGDQKTHQILWIGQEESLYKVVLHETQIVQIWLRRAQLRRILRHLIRNLLHNATLKGLVNFFEDDSDGWLLHLSLQRVQFVESDTAHEKKNAVWKVEVKLWCLDNQVDQLVLLWVVTLQIERTKLGDEKFEVFSYRCGKVWINTALCEFLDSLRVARVELNEDGDRVSVCFVPQLLLAVFAFWRKPLGKSANEVWLGSRKLLFFATQTTATEIVRQTANTPEEFWII